MPRTYLFNVKSGDVHIRDSAQDHELTDLEDPPCYVYQEKSGGVGWYKSFVYKYSNGDSAVDWDGVEEHEVPEEYRLKLLLLQG